MSKDNKEYDFDVTVEDVELLRSVDSKFGKPRGTHHDVSKQGLNYKEFAQAMRNRNKHNTGSNKWK